MSILILGIPTLSDERPTKSVVCNIPLLKKQKIGIRVLGSCPEEDMPLVRQTKNRSSLFSLCPRNLDVTT